MRRLSEKDHHRSKHGIKHKHISLAGLHKRMSDKDVINSIKGNHGLVDESLGKGYDIGKIKPEYRKPLTSQPEWVQKGLQSTAYRIYSDLGESTIGPIAKVIGERPSLMLSDEHLMKTRDRKTFQASKVMAETIGISDGARKQRRKNLVQKWWQVMFNMFPTQTANAIQQFYMLRGVAAGSQMGLPANPNPGMKRVIDAISVGSAAAGLPVVYPSKVEVAETSVSEFTRGEIMRRLRHSITAIHKIDEELETIRESRTDRANKKARATREGRGISMAERDAYESYMKADDASIKKLEQEKRELSNERDRDRKIMESEVGKQEIREKNVAIIPLSLIHI